MGTAPLLESASQPQARVCRNLSASRCGQMIWSEFIKRCQAPAYPINILQTKPSFGLSSAKLTGLCQRFAQARAEIFLSEKMRTTHLRQRVEDGGPSNHQRTVGHEKVSKTPSVTIRPRPVSRPCAQ